MARGRKIEPSQLGRRRRRRRNKKFLFWLIICIIIFASSIGLSHLSGLRISDITLEGNTFSSTDNMTLAVKKDLEGNYYYLFPKNNILIFPKGQIEKKLLAANPSIKGMKIHRQTLNTLKISVEERKPAAIWCRNDNECFFLDDSGFIFYLAPNYSNDLYFVYSGAIEAENPIGHQYLDQKIFQDINNFLNEVKKINVDAVALTAVSQNDFRLTLRTGGEIRFNMEAPLDKTLSNLESLIDKNNLNETHLNLADLDYLDLRFGNKIFYKLKSGTTATSTL